MRARDRIYHVDCFRCVACQRRLVSGDEFAVRRVDGRLVCRDHWDHDGDAAAAVRSPSSSTMEPRCAVEAPVDCVASDGLPLDADATTTSSTVASNSLLTKKLASGVNSNVSVAKKKPGHIGSFSAAVISVKMSDFTTVSFIRCVC